MVVTQIVFNLYFGSQQLSYFSKPCTFQTGIQVSHVMAWEKTYFGWRI